MLQKESRGELQTRGVSDGTAVECASSCLVSLSPQIIETLQMLLMSTVHKNRLSQPKQPDPPL